MFFPLLLLICSLTTVQPQAESDNEFVPHGRETEAQGRGTLNTSDQGPTCVQDIHTVLREMTALLAEQRVEMRHLQRENEAQAAKLRELELQNIQQDKLEQQVQAQAAKLREIELKMTQLDKLELQKIRLDKLEQQLQAQAGELTTIKSRTNVTENQVAALKNDAEVKQVAFSASLLESGSGTLGPFNTHTNLVFRHVFINVGNSYNPHTGFFIAPVRGAYHFQFYVSAYGHASHPSAAILVRNGQHICTAYELQPSGYGTSANGVTLPLEVGDVVFLYLRANARIYDDGNHYSTFSGHLLFTM